MSTTGTENGEEIHSSRMASSALPRSCWPLIFAWLLHDSCVLPLIFTVLDKYREVFEQFEEYVDFANQFSDFIDVVKHQEMLRRGSLRRLLDPIISDTDDLQALVCDLSLADRRWHDGSLDPALKQRLASEHDRFFVFSLFFAEWWPISRDCSK